MPVEPNSQQLQAWYKKFSEVLLKNAEIDVNSPKDLGRVKNFQITKWDTTNPSTPDVKISYAYANEAPEPFSDTATKQTHSVWMETNLKPAVTDEQIRQLYNMSREGTLMITAPTSGLQDILMVHTDSHGNITTSLPASAYRDGKNENLPEDQQIPKTPVKPESSLKPEDYNIAPKPVAPKEPANMDPGFWSWVGYMFGFDTDYAKLRRYELEKSAYEDDLAAWKKTVKEKPSHTVTNKKTGETQTIAYDDYRLAIYEHEQYSQQFEVFKADPLGKFSVIANSAAVLADGQFWKNEQHSLASSHISTPREHAKQELETVNNRLGFEKRTDLLVHHWLGHNADPKKAKELYAFRIDDFSPKQLELPKGPGFDQMPADKQAEYTKDMSTLFDLAALGAISHPDILGKELKYGCTEAETARVIFGPLFNDMFTGGRENATEYFKHVDPAREKALAAMEAYSNGEKGPLGELLGCGMRQMLREAAALEKFTNHALNTPYLIGKLYNVLQKNPDLLQASGLNENELQEAQANAELYQIMRQGLQAKKDILDHVFEKNTLSADQLQKSAQDVLLFHSVVAGMSDGFKKSDAAVQEGKEYQALFVEFFSRDANMMTRAAKTKDEAADTNRREFVKNRMNFLTSNYPANKFVMQLADKNFVKEYMQAIQEKTNAHIVGNMSRRELWELFSKGDNQIVSTLMPSSKLAPAPKKDAPDLQAQKQVQAGAPGL